MSLSTVIDWSVSPGRTPYLEAVAAMEARAEAIAEGRAADLVWVLEHPPLYTAGTTARAEDLKDPDRFPVFQTGRGGQFTYHGPGQRVAYVMMDLRRRGRDVRGFVQNLEAWLADALSEFGVEAGPREGRVGVWVDRSRPGEPREDKIAAIGVRVRKWVSFHGVALNVDPDLEHFAGITPCGISDPNLGVTSLLDLGCTAGMDQVDAALRAAFAARFQRTPVTAHPPI